MKHRVIWQLEAKADYPWEVCHYLFVDWPTAEDVLQVKGLDDHTRELVKHFGLPKYSRIPKICRMAGTYLGELTLTKIKLHGDD